MKKREGFVSNSSASSFVVKKADLTPLQIVLIKNHAEVGHWLELGYALEWPWFIRETATKIEGETTMDNFRMSEFFDEIGVDSEKVKWWHS